MSTRRTPAGRSRAGHTEHPNLKDAATDFIRDGIVSGRFGAGAKVDQDEVAGILGISRLPVREALIELAQKGFVVAIPRRGAFVAELTVDDIHDHFEVLAMVFALIARRAAKTFTATEIEELRSIQHELAATDDMTRLRPLHREFWVIVNREGASARLLSILRFLSGALPSSYYLASPSWAATEAHYSERMLEALEAHDADAAAAVAKEHLEQCAVLTVDHLRRQGYWPSGADGEPGGGHSRTHRPSELPLRTIA